MKGKSVEINLLFFTCLVCLFFYSNNVSAQKILYSSDNVFVGNPDQLQLVANIAGNHHLLRFSKNENPVIFIFNSGLELQTKITMPVKFPEKSQVSIIPFDNYYYICINSRFSRGYLLWKIDGNGNFSDLSALFKNLLASQSHNIKLGFQLIARQKHLWMVYHTALEDIEKSTIIMVQTDSLLNVVFTHKVVYDFNRDEEKLQQEILIFGKYLLVLKTLRSTTALELMKINLATGYSITHTFTSSGYFYSQSTLSINSQDSSVTVSALLTEPGTTINPKQFVFVSRLNKILFEEVPFTILKSQFKKNTGTNFLLVDEYAEWKRFRIRGEQKNNMPSDNNISLFQDLTMPGDNADVIRDINRMLQKTEQRNSTSDSWDGFRGIRFSLLDKDLKIISDSLINNTKDSYTIKPDQFIRFAVNNKEYMLLGQQFVKKSRGLLMVNTNDTHQLIYTDVRVNDRNDYLLSKSQLIKKAIIIPFIHKLEAGLVKISMD